MVNTLRRFSQPIMVVITVLVIISFANWGPSFTRSIGGGGTIFTLYGRDYSVESFNRQMRKVQVFKELGEDHGMRGGMMMGEYAQAVPGAMYIRPTNDPINQRIVEYSFIFEHEADALGLTSTPEERLEQLKRTPKFLDMKGDLDPTLVKRFQERTLGPLGFTEADFDAIFLHGEVRARKLRTLVGSTFAASPEEVRERLIAEHLTTYPSYVAFKAEDFRKDVKATDEEILKYYNENADKRYMSLEKRRVRYAAFRIPEPADGKPLDPSKNNDLLQQTANNAFEFHKELEDTKGDFDALAKKYGAEVGETKTAFAQDAPPDEIEVDCEALGEAAFKLTPEQPYSEQITSAQGTKKGAYVLKLVETKKPEKRPFEDVKADAEAMVIGKKVDDLAKAKATEMQPKIEEAMKAGKTFAQAAESLGLKVVAHGPIGGMQRPPREDFTSTVSAEAAKLAPGKISQAVSAGGAWLIVHVDYRPPVDEKVIADGRESVATMVEEGPGPQSPGKRDVVYMDWFDERSVAAGVPKMR